jgi:hypothetical protein
MHNVQFRGITGCGIEDGSVDVVTVMHNQALARDPARVLQVAHRLLRPGGLLAVCWNDR